MVRKSNLLVFLLIVLNQLPSFGQNYRKTLAGIEINLPAVDIILDFYNQSTVRVQKSLPGWKYTKNSLVVTAKPQKGIYSLKEIGNILQLSTTSIVVAINKTSGEISYSTKNGESLLRENGFGKFTPRKDANVGAFDISQSFYIDPDEAIYGLGIMQDGKMNKRGCNLRLTQRNTEDSSPVVHSIKGYAVFWDNYSTTKFKENKGLMTFSSEVAQCIDYYFTYGGDADSVVAQIRSLSGEVPMVPLWTYGFWQSKQRYKTQQEILDVVHKYRALGIPLDGIIQDWQYWGDNYHWNSMEFNPTTFPNPQAMVDDIHKNNAHVIISIWSSFGPKTKPFDEMKSKGHQLDFWTWPTTGVEGKKSSECPSGVRPYDAFSKEARDIYWKYLTNLYRYDMDGWWMDSTEPDHMYGKDSDMDLQTAMGSYRSVRNAFPLMAVGGVYDHQRKLLKLTDKRIFILTRSCFTGQQRTGANVWSGDLKSTWQSLRKQVPAGLNFALTGNPNFNSDIGGFFCGEYNTKYNDGVACINPAYHELYVRWLQFGAFTPMMRSHGTNAPREIYQFGKKGEPTYDAIEKMIRLRYTLVPYIYSTAWQVCNYQSSFMRPLMMDFAHDKRTWDINDEYMFGHSLLVAPVLHAQYTPESITKIADLQKWEETNGKVDFTKEHDMQVYLPAGAQWYDWWTGRKYQGGREVKIDTHYDEIPFFVKAGSILPLGPDVQYVTEKKWDNLTVNIYPGSDGKFVFYEDEFDNYNYTKGAYTEIEFVWDDTRRILTIGERKGTYKGMLKQRTFCLKMINGPTRTVRYDGSQLKVNF